MMSFWAQLTFGIFFGFIFGAINELSKKVFLCLLFLLAIVMISIFIFIPGSANISYGWADWGSIIGYLIGYYSGKFTVREAKEE